jgi:hypothetical protein
MRTYATIEFAKLMVDVGRGLSRYSISERKARAGALRSHARNCQKAAIDHPRSAHNAAVEARKAHSYAQAANRMDSTIVSYRAVAELDALASLLERQDDRSYFAMDRSSIKSVNIS